MEVLVEALAAPVVSGGTSAWIRVPALQLPKLALIARKKSGSGNLDIKVQGSPNAEDAFDWVTFDQLVDASGTQELAGPNAAWPYLRTVRTIGGTAVYDLWVYLNGIYGGRRA